MQSIGSEITPRNMPYIKELRSVCIHNQYYGGRKVLARHRIGKDRLHDIGIPYLIYAARYGHIGIVKLMVDYFSMKLCDIRSNNNDALRWACRNGHYSVVLYLCQKWLKLNDIKTKNNDALHWACRNGHLGIVRFLTNRGALSRSQLLQGCSETIKYAMSSPNGSAIVAHLNNLSRTAANSNKSKIVWQINN